MEYILASKYGIISSALSRVPGGFSAKAYRVTGESGADYFLKVYDRSLPTTNFFVERIDVYMPLLDWLSASPNLQGRVLTPIKTLGGAYKAESGNCVYVLFLFVNGVVPGIHGMTHGQTIELAEILARLHDVGEIAPLEKHGLAEDVSLSFCERLKGYLTKMTKDDIFYDIFASNTDMLVAAVGEIQCLRDAVRIGYSPLVLCHGDAHGNNVIQSERLVLADWEDLRIAPAEADLFIYEWHEHGDTLLEAYALARRDYRINRELLYFYVLRRRIEDVWVDVQRLTEESPYEVEAAKLSDLTRQGVEKIHELRHRRKTFF